MYASASTWTFNVVRRILQTAQMAPLDVVFVSGNEKNRAWSGPGRITLIKSHEIRNETRVAEIARHSSKLLVTIRDPRDSVTSLMQAHNYEFSRALDYVETSALLCRSFSKDRRAKLFRYESGFFENMATVTEIAAHLGYELATDQAEAIFASLTRSEVEKHIGTLPKIPGILKDQASGDFLDPQTQWHSHHAGRTGETGKWKTVLTAGQESEILSRLSFTL